MSTENNRDDFNKKVKEQLAYRVGCRCSNPNCGRITTGPKESNWGYVNIGVAAHICAAAPGGKRYDKYMSKEDRSSVNNGIWLCQSCAKIIDSDEEKYSTELLQKWKQKAEDATRHELIQEKYNYSILQSSLIDIQRKLAEENIYGNKKHPLYKMFVPYSISAKIEQDELYYEDVIKALIEITNSYSEKFILMLGDYGVGKSSTLKMLASIYNNGKFLYISLKDVLIFSDNIIDGIYDYCGRAYQIYFDFSKLNNELILLLDGFDELQRHHSNHDEDLNLFTQIYTLSRYPLVKVILSSRGTAFLNNQKLLNYSTIYLNDFNKEQIEKWIENWKAVNQDEEIKISVAGIEERNLLEVCKNKLILYLVARIYNDELNESRQYTKAYIYKSFYDWTIAGKFIEDTEYNNTNYQSAGTYDDKTYRRILQDIALIITQYASNELIEYQSLKDKIIIFQKEEIVQDVFEINKHLFTRHFFSTKFENQVLFVEFSHKSLREYLYAEKIFDFLKKTAVEKNVDIGEWIQFGRNKRLSNECFIFLGELLSEMSLEMLEYIAEQMYRLSSILLISDGRFNKYVVNNNIIQDKAIMNISESFHRSLILSVIAGILNNLCYNLILEKNFQRKKSVKQISCESIYKICDYYLSNEARYIDMYPIFLQFIKYINMREEEASYINYIRMNLKQISIYDSIIHSGVIQEIQTDNTDICNTHFISVQIQDSFFRNGKIEMCSFNCCNLKNVTFINIHFYNVAFEVLMDENIKFESCTFSETSVKNYIHNGRLERLNLESNEPIDIYL